MKLGPAGNVGDSEGDNAAGSDPAAGPQVILAPILKALGAELELFPGRKSFCLSDLCPSCFDFSKTESRYSFLSFFDWCCTLCFELSASRCLIHSPTFSCIPSTPIIRSRFPCIGRRALVGEGRDGVHLFFILEVGENPL